MNKKVIISCILTLTLCVSLIAGGTFALFTSESETNVAITSGKVEVVATIENLTLYSPTLINVDGTVADAANKATESVFANGGTAAINGAVLSLDRVTPGDKASFQIKVVNNSNVDIMYRTVIRTLEDNGLVDGLMMNIGDESYDGTTQYTPWKPLNVAGTELTLDCSVELPTTAGNEYQDKSCKIVYTVEAVQGNTVTDDNMAYIGDTGYATLQGAIDAVQSGETVEITRPGTYDAFEIPTGKTGVTVKGIIGADKASSTVIRTTATENIRTYGDGTKLENLWIETPVAQSIGWMQAGAITPYYNTDSGYVAKDITVTGCHLDGHNVAGFAMLYCSTGLEFTNNTVENFDVGVYVMNDGTAADGIVVNNNKFINVTDPVNGYWGGKPADDAGAVQIMNNTVEGVDVAYITVWDYAQNSADYSAFKNVEISGNNGNIVYALTHFNYKTATPYTISVGEGTQEIRYLSKVAFDMPAAEGANYVIKNVDGSDIDSRIGNNGLNQSITVVDETDSTKTKTVAGVYTLTTGNYYLVEKATGFKFAFSVTEPVAGEQQLVKLDTLVMENATDLRNFAASVNGGNGKAATGKDWANTTVVLVNDIDLDNKAWTPIGQTGATTFEGVFDGQGHTISNLYIDSTQQTGANYSSGLFGWIESGKTVKNVNINGATVKGNHNVGTIVGYITDADIENCNVTNATIINNHANGKACGDKAGVIAGYVGTDCFLSKCTAANSSVIGGRDAGQLFGASYSIPNYCTATNVTVSATGTCTGNNVQNAVVGRPFYKTVETTSTATKINDMIAGEGTTTYVNGVDVKDTVEVAADKKVTIENSSVTIAGTDSAVNVANGASLTINDGTFLGSSMQIINAQANAASVVINNGDYKGSTITWQGGTCETVINGGTFDLWALAVNDGASAPVTVNGGTFEISTTLDADTGCPIVINGGDFTIESGSFSNAMEPNLSINGGTFNVDPSAFVNLDTHTVTEANGIYTVTAK